MKAPILAVVVAAGAALLMGCGAEDYESEAAYPAAQTQPPIGYTPPATQVAASQPTFAPPPVPAQVEQPRQPQGDVTVGEEAAPPPPAEAGYGPDDQYPDQDPSALTDFRSALDPYGTWVDDPTYGTTWVPSPSVVGSDFTPYVSAGHWTYDDDYVWVSDYDWGWAPFHYGRWAYASPYGWEWIPGRAYAGAWVSWRYGWGDWPYVGWAPLGPTWGWRNGMVFGLGYPGAAPYSFCASRDLFAPQGPRVVYGSMAGSIGPHTRPWVGASPSVNGRVAAHPSVGGPPPSVLNIPAQAIAHGAAANRGVMQARAFSHASTAVSLGAHAPAAVASRGGAGRSPAYGGGAGAPPSHFGGRMGAGFSGSLANQRPSYSLGSRPYYGGGAAGSRGPYGGSFHGAPAYGGPSHVGGGFYGAPPGVHGAPPGSGGGGHRGYSGDDGGGGGYHGGGHGGGGGFRGGGGGGHGGGGHR